MTAFNLIQNLDTSQCKQQPTSTLQAGPQQAYAYISMEKKLKIHTYIYMVHGFIIPDTYMHGSKIKLQILLYTNI